MCPTLSDLTPGRRSAWRAGLGVLAALWGGGALAQAGVGPESPPAEPEPALEPVVVSASRAAQRSFDAPAALSAIDRPVIEAAGPQVNLSESLNRVPGLTLLNRQNYAQDLQLSIRGFGARATFGIRGIRLLIDGIPATTPDGQAQGSSVALTSTERIEVLRGPLAQLYGNAAGGVIQAWTRDAPAVPELGLQWHAGAWGMRRTVWQAAGRSGAVGVLADYSTFDTDGYRHHSRTARRQFNAKLTVDPGEDTRVQWVVNHFDMPLAQDPLGLTAAQVAADPRQSGPQAESRRVRKITRQTQVGASVTHAIDAHQTVTARAYAGTRDNLQYLVSQRWVGLYRAYHGLGLQWNAQASLVGVPVQWAAGVEIDHAAERRQGGDAVLGERTRTTRDEDNIAGNQDLFLQATALLAPRWSLTAGVRHSTVRLRSRDQVIGPDDPDGSGTVRYRATQPVLGLTWHAHEALNVYANAGHGFETPTLAEVAYRDNGSVVAQFNPALAASTSRHLELGAKWRPSARLRLDVALFRIRTADEIVVARSSGGQAAFQNAPGTTRTGLEIGAAARWGAHWRATAAVTAMRAEFARRFCPATGCAPATAVEAGNRLPGIPQHFVFAELLWAAAGYTPAGSPRPGGWRAGVEWVQAGRLYANDTNTASAPGYSLLHWQASHAWPLGGGWLTAYARLDNATDRRHVGSVIVNQSAGQFYEPAPGRHWTAGVRWVMPVD